MDEILKTERFTREAPIEEAPARLIHYCAKDNMRQFFVVCQSKGCRHFRPLRPIDEGSCSFRPKAEKDEAKRFKRIAKEILDQDSEKEYKED